MLSTIFNSFQAFNQQQSMTIKEYKVVSTSNFQVSYLYLKFILFYKLSNFSVFTQTNKQRAKPMQNKVQWNQKTFKFTSKKAHSDNLIGICYHSPNTFLSSSEDSTVRLWDLRTQSSTKLIRNTCLTPELSNPTSNNQNSVYIGSGPNLYQFDMRKQQIFVENITKKCQQAHYDNINRIKYSQKYKQIVCCDDQGDIRAYSLLENEQNLIPNHKMQQQHINICNAVDYVYCQAKSFEGKRMCLSGGFDSTLILWSIQQQKPIKKIPIQQLFKKYEIKSQKDNFPFIHSLSTFGSSILISLQTGHVLCLPLQDLKKPKFILQASLTRVNDCKVVQIMGKNILISCSIDESFTLFDFQQRVNGQPKFIKKYGTICQPVQIQLIDNTILVVTNSASLSFYELKI